MESMPIEPLPILTSTVVNPERTFEGMPPSPNTKNGDNPVPGDAAQPNPWDAFWVGRTDDADNFVTSIAEKLSDEWRQFFEAELAARSVSRCIDLAAGSGAVAMLASEVAGQNLSSVQFDLHCLDYSPAACAALADQIPLAHVAVGLCQSPPFPPRSFDIVVSQFGIEYGGVDAFGVAAKLLNDGGVFRAICHKQSGGIFTECATNAKVAEDILGTGVLGAAKAAVAAIEYRAPGQAGVAPVAVRQSLAQAVQRLEGVVTQYGAHAAGGLAAKLYGDLGRMFRAIDTFAKDDVIAWCDRFDQETRSYQDRMNAMVNAALSDKDLESICTLIADAGAEVIDHETGPVRDQDEVIGWRITARQSPQA